MTARTVVQKIRESSLAGRAYVALQRLQQLAPTKKGEVVFFPDQLYTGTAGDLRSVAVARELRRFGWKAIVVPPWLSLPDRQKVLRSVPRALILFQQSRHPLNHPQLYPGRTCLIDIDDADILKHAAHVGPILRQCAAVIAGSRFLADQFLLFNPNVSIIWTGTYITSVASKLPAADPPILCWAQSHPFDYPVEAALMLSVWTRLAEHTTNFAVAVYSTDREACSRWLKPLVERGITLHLRPLQRYRDFIHTLTQDTIGLQPIAVTNPFSLGKSFGKVLAYVVAGVPVISSNELEYARFFRDGENGLLVGSEDDWVAACIRLLENPSQRASMARAAHTDLLRQLTSRAAAEQLDSVLTPVLAGQASSTQSPSPHPSQPAQPLTELNQKSS